MKSDRTEADVLYELLLKLGFAIAVPIEHATIAGEFVHNVGVGSSDRPGKIHYPLGCESPILKPDEDRDAFLNSMGMMYPIHWDQPRMDKDFVETVKIAKTITRRVNQHGGGIALTRAEINPRPFPCKRPLAIPDFSIRSRLPSPHLPIYGEFLSTGVRCATCIVGAPTIRSSNPAGRIECPAAYSSFEMTTRWSR